jgi:hypothetical protein
MKSFMIAAIVSLVTIGGIRTMSNVASAHEFDGNGGGYGGYAGGIGGGYGSYYGNGGHDATPHWHQTNTPYGSSMWFGNGAHDFQPHMHSYSPNSYQGYSSSPWGNTTSYYSQYPGYTYMPW